MTETTAVIFRKFRAQPHDVIALFPYVPGDVHGLMMDSYLHVGQHGQASPNIIDWTRPASPEEYAALKRELEHLPEPYVLKVIRRTPPDAARVRQETARQQRIAYRNRVITPDNSPDRFTEREAGLFRAGLCGWVTEYGTVRGVVHCGEPSDPGASMGHCAMHDAEMLVDHFPDGSSRYDANPHYDQMPDYEARSARAHLEYLRGELRAERISWGELAELQGLTEFIEPGDTELLEAAGVPEFPDDSPEQETAS